MNEMLSGASGFSAALGAAAGGSNNTSLTIKSSPPKTAAVARRLGVHVGYLTKRNESQQWQRRYCALVPQTLLYYFDGEQSETPPRGIIDLEYYTDVEIVAKNTLRLSTPPDIPLRSFFFRADSEEQCAAWAAALTRERFFVVADERDAYQKLQTEFQKESSATAEKVERHRERVAATRAAIERAEARQHEALRSLRAQAISLGLSEDAAASLRDAKDAVREVAHRLHYHVRRASRLEGALDALRDARMDPGVILAQSSQSQGGQDQVGDSADSNNNNTSTTTTSPSSQQQQQQHHHGPQREQPPDAASRVREIDELREKVSAVRRAREREATARAALESEKAALRARLEELQARVHGAAERRVRVETKVSELQDQKRLLVREVKSTRRAIAKVEADLRHAALSGGGGGDDDRKTGSDSHRDLALRRVGLGGASHRGGDRQASSLRHHGTASSDVDHGDKEENYSEDRSSTTGGDSIGAFLAGGTPTPHGCDHAAGTILTRAAGAKSSAEQLLDDDPAVVSATTPSRRWVPSPTPPDAPDYTTPKTASTPTTSPPASSTRFALVCKRCGGTVEGPQFSTCKCLEPKL